MDVYYFDINNNEFELIDSSDLFLNNKNNSSVEIIFDNIELKKYNFEGFNFEINKYVFDTFNSLNTCSRGCILSIFNEELFPINRVLFNNRYSIFNDNCLSYFYDKYLRDFDLCPDNNLIEFIKTYFPNKKVIIKNNSPIAIFKNNNSLNGGSLLHDFYNKFAKENALLIDGLIKENIKIDGLILNDHYGEYINHRCFYDSDFEYDFKLFSLIKKELNTLHINKILKPFFYGKNQCDILNFLDVLFLKNEAINLTDLGIYFNIFKFDNNFLFALKEVNYSYNFFYLSTSLLFDTNINFSSLFLAFVSLIKYGIKNISVPIFSYKKELMGIFELREDKQLIFTNIHKCLSLIFSKIKDILYYFCFDIGVVNIGFKNKDNIVFIFETNEETNYVFIYKRKRFQFKLKPKSFYLICL